VNSSNLFSTGTKNFKRPLVIAGPCSAESREQVLSTANELKGIEEVQFFRAGLWKPRTRPETFEGVGEIGLSWLKEVKEQTSLKVGTEVANSHHVELCLKNGIDVLWIGARTTTNPFAVQEIADSLRGVDIPVLIKNPINADISLWIGAIERMSKAGLKDLMAIHRGFSSSLDSKYRNRPLWKIPIELKHHYPELPIICDPSHICGQRSTIEDVCQKAMDIHMDGLMIETHIKPEQALSDAKQQITPGRLFEILKTLSYKNESSHDVDFERTLEILRDKIDIIDLDIIEALAQRMEVVEQIAKIKHEKNVSAFQQKRMDEILKQRVQKGIQFGLMKDYIQELFNIVHAESVKKQTDFFKNKNQ